MKYLFVLVILGFATLTASAQSRIIRPEQSAQLQPCHFGGSPVPILLRNPYKVKAMKGLDGGTARVGDYLEFQTMETIYMLDKPPTEAFKTQTSIFAVVTARKHRHFPVVNGYVEIALEPLRTWDGREIQIGISRHSGIQLTEAEISRLSPSERQAELNKRAKNSAKPCRVGRDNCVGGRRNADASLVVPAVAGAAAGGVISLAKEEETRFIAATAFFSIAKEVGNLLNGVDGKIAEGEIFDLYIGGGSSVCKVPAATTAPATRPSKVTQP